MQLEAASTTTSAPCAFRSKYSQHQPLPHDSKTKHEAQHQTQQHDSSTASGMLCSTALQSCNNSMTNTGDGDARQGSAATCGQIPCPVTATQQTLPSATDLPTAQYHHTTVVPQDSCGPLGEVMQRNDARHSSMVLVHRALHPKRNNCSASCTVKHMIRAGLQREQLGGARRPLHC